MRLGFGKWRTLLLITYAAVIGIGITASMPYLCLSLPNKLRQVFVSMARLPAALANNPSQALLEVGKLLGALFFFLFFFRFVKMLLPGSLWQKGKGMAGSGA